MLLLRRSYCVALSMLICGCGGNTGPLLVGASGTVTIDDKPLSGATVTIVDGNGGLSNGFTDSAGKFNITSENGAGVSVGNAKVGITKYADSASAEVVSGNLKSEDMQKMQMATHGKAKASVPKSEIPEIYGNPEKSGLTAKIDADASKNVFTFPLVSQ